MAEKNSAQTNRQTKKQTDRHYENNGHLAVNQKKTKYQFSGTLSLTTTGFSFVSYKTNTVTLISTLNNISCYEKCASA